MKKIVILDALRTPIGKFHGGLGEFSAVNLGTYVTTQLLQRNKAVVKNIEQVIFGNVLQAGNGQNVARQVAINAGLAPSVVATTVNEVCGSGIKAVQLARQLLQLGDAQVVIAGGTESMSLAPKLSYGEDTPLVSSMLVDGLTDAFSQAHMGLTAENVAKLYGVTREEQDAFAFASHQKALAAQKAGHFSDQLAKIKVNGQPIVDECIRATTTLEKMSTLKPVFKTDGTVTAGNASGISDGAAAVILTTEDFAIAHNLSYLAEIVDFVEVGVEPSVMGIAPVSAIQKIIARNSVALSDIDIFEINEAFAATSIAVEKELHLDSQKVNPWGGSIALGHPIGATGARLITTLTYQLHALQKKYGIATLCVGGGLGLAMLIKRPTPITETRFYKMTRSERLKNLLAAKKITPTTFTTLAEQELAPDLAEHLIENQISDFAVPVGVIPELSVNDKKYCVPLATEEPSVVAAASFGAKMAGNFEATSTEHLVRGQIILQNVTDGEKLSQFIGNQRSSMLLTANKSYPSMVARGGGLKDIRVRVLEENFASIDCLIETKDAMGANVVNTILEACATYLRPQLEARGEIIFSILSNLTTESLVTVKAHVPVENLAKGQGATAGLAIAKKIVAATRVAELDEYRATTHNKGIMNGVDAVVLATGNDTRAVSAAAHAHAARLGRYESLSHWHMSADEKFLDGELTMPLALATVGGATKVMPKAHANLSLFHLTNNSARELGEVVAATGLAQNLAALRALVSEGIQAGHMKLQARSLAMRVGATGEQIDTVARLLQNGAGMNEARALKILNRLQKK